MGPADLRPLGVGEILDLGIKIYRRRFGTLVRAVAVVVVPVAILSALVQTSVSFDADASVDGGDAATAIVGGILAGILGYLAGQMATAASFEIVSGDYLDESPTWQSSLRAARGKLGSLVWLSILYGLALVLGLIACVIPAIYLYGAFSLAVPVLLFEDVRGSDALGRSRSLVKGRWWPVAGVLLVGYILSGIVQTGIRGVLLGVVSAGDNEAIAALAQAIATSLSSVLTTPFTAAVIAVLYFDARVRKEGFDLELLAGQIGVAPSEGRMPELAPEPRPEEPPFWPPPPGWRPGAPPDA
jgi:hypothetical protein